MPYGIPAKRWEELSKFQQSEAKYMWEQQQERKKKADTRTLKDIAPDVPEEKKADAPKSETKKNKTPTAEELLERERKRKRGYYNTR